MNLPMQFGPYLLLERISVGGMAEVYKAKEYGVEGFERTVAVKRILPHVAEDEEFIAMFKDEAKIAVQLNHGNIAQIYNLGNEQDSFYIALEYVNGRDLRAIFQKCQQVGGAMPSAQACYVIMKICEGLDYAHNKKDKYNRPLNIVHRDVSPPNILVSFEGEVKLIDFGVAKAAGRASRTQAGILKGKFGYMSPEQVRGMPLDRRSDVFSVGVVLFEVLTGQRLFQADTDFATLEKVRAVDVPRPSSINPDIPKPLENIMYKALAREPEQRYQSSIELHDELQAFMFAQGMFYSRKDLASWMRDTYAREIELEKEKAARTPSEPPPSAVPSNGQRKRTTLAPGGAVPDAAGARPPPPPGGPRLASPPPPPPPRATPPPAPASTLGAGRKPKRKTMVMTTARPNLPLPPGHAPPPAPPGASAREGRELDAPTIPMGSMSAPRPRAALPKATASYAARPNGSAPASSDLEWDDDELETRLFEEQRREQDAAAARAIDGAQDSVPTRVDLQDHPPRRSVTVSPGVVPQASPTGRGLTVVPDAAIVPFPPSPPPTPTMVLSEAPAYPQQPQQPMSYPPAPGQGPGPAVSGATVAPGMHQAPMMQPVQQQYAPYAGQSYAGPSYAGPSYAGPSYAGASMSGPMPVMSAPPGYGVAGPGFGPRPRKSNPGFVALIVAAAIVLFAGSVASVYFFVLRDRGGGGTVASSSSSTPAPSASGDTATPAAATAQSGVLTVEVSPEDAKVKVDGASVSGPSPFVHTVAAGKHTVRVEHGSYLPFEKEVDIPLAGLRLPVKLAHKDIALVLQVEPPEASVQLLADGKLVGTAQSGSKIDFVRDLGVKYEVEASAGGFTSQRVELSFTGDANEKVELALPKDTALAIAGGTTVPQPIPSPTVDPEPAAVVPTKAVPATKASTGGTTPKPKPKNTTTTPKPKADPEEPKPEPEPKDDPKPVGKTATLRIGGNAGVKPAKVYVDDKLVGTTPISSYKVTPGRHTVKWVWEGGKTLSETVTIGDGEAKTLKRG